MSPHSYTLSWFRANQSLLLLLKAACCREAEITNCIVFGLTRSGIEPTTCNTRGDHTNHYISDVVICDCYVKPCEQFFQLYQGKNKTHSDTMMVMSDITRPIRSVGFFYETTVRGYRCYSTYYSDSYHFPLNTACSVQKQQIQIL